MKLFLTDLEICLNNIGLFPIIKNKNKHFHKKIPFSRGTGELKTLETTGLLRALHLGSQAEPRPFIYHLLSGPGSWSQWMCSWSLKEHSDPHLILYESGTWMASTHCPRTKDIRDRSRLSCHPCTQEFRESKLPISLRISWRKSIPLFKIPRASENALDFSTDDLSVTGHFF